MGGSKPPNYFGQMADAITKASQIQADSAQKAMDIAQQQFDASLAVINQQYAQARSDLAPYRDMGSAAIPQLEALMGINNPDLNNNTTQALINGYSGSSNNSNASVLQNALDRIPGGAAGGPAQAFDRAVAPGIFEQSQQNSNKNDYLTLLKAGGVDPSQLQGPIDTNAENKWINNQVNTVKLPNNQNPQQVFTAQAQQMAQNGSFRQSVDPSTLNIDYSKIQSDPKLMAMWNKLGLPDIKTQPKDPSQTAIQALQNSPQYKFQMQQGTQAVQNSAAAQGMLDSGNTGQNLNQFGQGLAAQSYQQRIANLSSMVGSGQQSAAMSAQQDQSKGQDVASMQTTLGNTLGSGEMAKGNVLAQGLLGSTRWNILAQAQNAQSSGGGIGQALGGAQSLLGMIGGM